MQASTMFCPWSCEAFNHSVDKSGPLTGAGGPLAAFVVPQFAMKVSVMALRSKVIT